MNRIKQYFGLFFIIGLLFPLCLMGQNVEKANQYFTEGAYPKAAEAYKKALNKEDLPWIKIRLADCYRFMNNFLEAEYWYSTVVGIPDIDPINHYYYGLMLKANGKFDQAQQAFEYYSKLVPEDSRGLRQIEACEKSDVFLTDPGVYQVNLANINTPFADFGAAFFDRGIVYSSESNGGKDQLYNRTNAPFLQLFYAEPQDQSVPEQLIYKQIFKTKAKQALHEGTVTFTRDLQTMYFTANNVNKKRRKDDQTTTINLQIYKAQGKNWSNVTAFEFNSDDYSVGHPCLSADGNTMYFTSDMPDGFGGTDIYVCYKNGDRWTNAQNLGGLINTEGNEMFPFIGADGTLYFASDALPGLGGLDIFRSTLLGEDHWSLPENLRTPINSNADDFSFIIADNGEYGYFSSNRFDGTGSDDIYAFTAKKLEIVEVAPAPVKIVPRPKNTNPPPVFRPQAKPKPTPPPSQPQPVPVTPAPPVKPVIYCELVGLIYDNKNKRPLEGAVVRLFNEQTNEAETFRTGSDGRYFFNLVQNTDFVIYVTKEGYFTVVENMSTKNRDCTNPLQKDLALDIAVAEIPVNPATGEMKEDIVINAGSKNSHPDLPLPSINHIYYDLNKYNIRRDAQIELDKIVDFMLSNPGLRIELGAHTDSRGSASYNQQLSERRAKAARDYIVDRGVASTYISYRGYGETQLVNNCADGVYCTEAQHQANRRTEFVITGYVGTGN